MEEKTYKLSKQFKETLLIMLTKSVMSTLGSDDDEDVYSIDEALDELVLGITHTDEVLILNPPKEIINEDQLKNIQARGSDLVVERVE